MAHGEAPRGLSTLEEISIRSVGLRPTLRMLGSERRTESPARALRSPTLKQRSDPRQEGCVTPSINEQIKDFHHFTMPVQSLERAERFYTGVFGAEITRRLSNHISVVLGTGPRIDL